MYSFQPTPLMLCGAYFATLTAVSVIQSRSNSVLIGLYNAANVTPLGPLFYALSSVGRDRSEVIENAIFSVLSAGAIKMFCNLPFFRDKGYFSLFMAICCSALINGFNLYVAYFGSKYGLIPINFINTIKPKRALTIEDRGDTGAKKIAEIIKINTTLQELRSFMKGVGDIGIKEIAEALKVNATLQRLRLVNSQIGDAGARYLAEALKVNATLQRLRLVSSQIGDAGARYLAEALKENTTLQYLGLRFNRIGDAGAKELAEALKINRALKYLDLSNNDFGDLGIKEIAEALKVNTTLQCLHLGGNFFIGTAGTMCLAEVLKVNATLQELHLRPNLIGYASIKKIAEALKDNYAITMISGINSKEINKITKRNRDLANRVAKVFKGKVEGRENARSLFKNSAGNSSFFKEVYELPISYADIQNLNKGGYAALKSRLIEEYKMSPKQSDDLIDSLKAVEHFIYLRDIILRCYESSYAPFMSVALKNPRVKSDLQSLHVGDYLILKVVCDEALSNEIYQEIAAKPKIAKPASFVQRCFNFITNNQVAAA